MTRATWGPMRPRARDEALGQGKRPHHQEEGSRVLCKLLMLGLHLITTGLKHGVCVTDRSMVSSFYKFLAHGVVTLPMSNPSEYPNLDVLDAASL